MAERKITTSDYFIHLFIRELFTYGDKASFVRIIKRCYEDKNNKGIDCFTELLTSVVAYFAKSANATEVFLYCIDLIADNEKLEHPELLIHELQQMDTRKESFFQIENLPPGAISALNSAISLYAIGMINSADNLVKIGIWLLISELFGDYQIDYAFDEISKRVIAEHQREKASKPRNPYYNEVMQVIQLTWEKYPKASPTGLRRKLFLHYHEHVCENTLGRWIKDSGLQPPKPDKYSSFELVHPQ
ncbi:hypothetical protein DPU22_14700 [Salmonella enterica subsp. enterica serovar Newport]|uniref:Uncharacterized protein n=1 Tax=Salmonella enterica I TaxID=59201 RepID=A0A3V2NW43_SALET|nr:hypothetical protein [Salmonella enterica subsp. enterica serovar Newport]EBX0576182.1 hypothetical protein [Salmonella enterica subsp. enterica serovar Utah]ECD3767836.1 hypothetical protein [Salmonella enterica subsp. enterica serovar Onderstepoort]EDT6460677.1 hypothetical protein [Salmonella enterica subsp. enterica]EHW6505953.1 hypothetical protein [Salmonella enterica]